jgi:hypothetical protein
MARLLTAGFETGSLQELNGAAYIVSAPSTAAARTGSYALALYGSVIKAGTAYVTHVLDADEEEIYFRMAWRVDPTAEFVYPHLQFINSAGIPQVTLEFDGPTQTFKLYLGPDSLSLSPGQLIASGSILLRTGTWYVIEGHVLCDTAAGVFTLKVNGVTAFSYSGATQADEDGPYLRVLKLLGAWGGGTLYIDDIAVNDISGSDQNTWIGLGTVCFLKANADGATTDFTPSAGSDHYALVDDVPRNTTDWVQGGTTPGDLELFAVEAAPDYITDIALVQVVWQAAVNTSGSNQLTGVVRQDTTEYPDAAGQVIVSIAPGFVLYRGDPLYVQPADDSVWDKTAVDALQVGVKIV